jgi:TldD protein
LNPAALPLSRLLRRGDYADAYLEETDHLTLRWEERRLDDVSQGSLSGLGLRFCRGEETRFGHIDLPRPVSGGLSAAALSRAGKLARDLAGTWPAGRPPRRRPCAASADHAAAVPPADVPLKEKVERLRRAEAAARAVPGVVQVSLSYGERVKRTVVVTSAGDVVEERRTYVVFSAEATAKSGDRLQTAYESAGGMGGWERLARPSPEEVAVTAARRAAAKLKAPSAPLGPVPVVIASEAGGTLIHEAIGHALEADGILQGTSPHFAGKVGRRVANEKVTVLDDPTLSGHRGSFHFDDEGVPSERTVLVEDGVLKTYLYDRQSARRGRRPPNGHGRRESYAHKAIPRMSNTFIAPGADSPEDIRRSLKRGLLVTRMGGGQVNTATGDFVFEVEEGWWVEDGRVKRLVRGANLLGNGPEVLRSIDRVGWDIGWSIGTCGKDGQGVPVSDGVPTLRIPKVVVGGTQDSQ